MSFLLNKRSVRRVGTMSLPQSILLVLTLTVLAHSAMGQEMEESQIVIELAEVKKLLDEQHENEIEADYYSPGSDLHRMEDA